MNWQEACLDPRLQNLPFKVELNEYGQAVLSPVKVSHSALQGEIEFLLRCEDGCLSFYGREGLMPHSRLAPDFPEKIQL